MPGYMYIILIKQLKNMFKFFEPCNLILVGLLQITIRLFRSNKDRNRSKNNNYSKKIKNIQNIREVIINDFLLYSD